MEQRARSGLPGILENNYTGPPDVNLVAYKSSVEED